MKKNEEINKSAGFTSQSWCDHGAFKAGTYSGILSQPALMSGNPHAYPHKHRYMVSYTPIGPFLSTFLSIIIFFVMLPANPAISTVAAVDDLTARSMISGKRRRAGPSRVHKPKRAHA